jgi:hypothetical protein
VAQSNANTAKQYLAMAARNAPAYNVVEIWKQLQYQRANILFRDGNYGDALKLPQEVTEFCFRSTTCGSIVAKAAALHFQQ